MRTRLFLLFAFAAVTVLMNGATAGNIAHGVEVVVIDAGHGGKFPGAHYGNVYEKDLTLKVALKLGKLIEEGMPGVKVVYTRKTDKALGTDLATDLQACRHRQQGRRRPLRFDPRQCCEILGGTGCRDAHHGRKPQGAALQ